MRVPACACACARDRGPAVRNAAQKAATRATGYRQSIASHQLGGQDRKALAEAARWMRAEAVHASRLRPRDAAALCGRLIAQVEALAAAIAGREGAGGRPAADRHRQAIADARGVGDHAAALSSAAQWLQAEAAAAVRADPEGHAALHRELAGRVAALAAEIPGYRAPRAERSPL